MWLHCLQEVSSFSVCDTLFSGALARALLPWGTVYLQACLLFIAYSENEHFSKSDRPCSSPKPAAKLRTSQGSCAGTCRKWQLERLCWLSSCPRWHWPAFKGSGHNVPGPPCSDRGQAHTKAGPMCTPEGTHGWKESKDFGKTLYKT